MVSVGKVINQKVFYEDIRTEYSESLARVYCSAASSQNASEANRKDCLSRTRNHIRSLKLGEFYNRKREIEGKILHSYVGKQEIQPNILTLFDSHHDPVFYHEKLQLLQDYADDQRVQKICVVGANLGYSILNFLVANPLATIVVFDNIDGRILTSDLSDPSAFTAAVNKLSKITLEKILELFPDRVINVISGSTKFTLPNFNKEFPEKMDCNLLFLDSQTQLGHFLLDLRESTQLLSPQYNRIIVDSSQLDNVRALISYYTAKINEKLECPSKLRIRQKKTCLQKSLQQNLNVVQQRGSDYPLAGGSCEGVCENIRFTEIETFAGFVLTPCVAMYTNHTEGLHMEFIFNYENCNLSLNYTQATHPQFTLVESNIIGQSLFLDSTQEVTVVELKFS